MVMTYLLTAVIRVGKLEIQVEELGSGHKGLGRVIIAAKTGLEKLKRAMDAIKKTKLLFIFISQIIKRNDNLLQQILF